MVPDVKLLTDHFLRQQRGGNIVGFRGAHMQRGYGIGGMFKSLARFAIPLFKQGAKAVGKRALKTATQVGQDVVDGQNFKESARTRGRAVFKDFAEQGAKTLLRQAGRRGEHSNLSSDKRQKLCDLNEAKPPKWKTGDESTDYDDSDSEMSQTSGEE